MTLPIRSLVRIAALALALAATAVVHADDYPSKSIRMVLPVAPGGFADAFSRIIADSMSQQFKQPVVVENRVGAGSTLSAALVGRSPPDGYSIVLVTAGATAIAPATMPNLNFDPKSITPIMVFARTPLIVTASTKFAPNNMAELIAYAKANPGKLNWGSQGPGGIQHLSGEMMFQAAGVNATAIHYPGQPPVAAAMMGGFVDVTIEAPGAALPNVKAGKVKGLAISSDRRFSGAPDLPTLREAGVPLSIYAWYGFFAPAGTPAPIIQKLHAAIQVAVNSKAFTDYMQASGAEPMALNAAESRKFIEEDTAVWTDLIRSLNLAVK